jgi:UDP:flavonoid glycosyltransferase YjiC (YdhE family)
LTAIPSSRRSPRRRSNFLFAKIFGPERAEGMLEDLLPLAHEWSPSVMVCEQAELAGPIVAATLGIPNVTHAFGHPLPAGPRGPGGGRDAAALGGTRPDRAALRRHVSAPLRRHESRSAEGVREQALPDILKLRPHDPAPAAETAGLPLVYVTFGTVFNRDLSLIATVVEGRTLPVKAVVTLGPGNEPPWANSRRTST